MKTWDWARAAARKSANAFAGGVLAAVAVVVLAGCAGLNNVRTDVTSYSDWTSAPEDKTYTFSQPLQLRNSLQLQSYEGLVKEELGKLGFRQVDAASAKLVVTLRPSVAVLYDYDYWPHPDPWFYRPYWRRGWPGYGPYGGFYGDPFFFDERVTPIYQRQLRIEIDRVNPPKRLYEATAMNEGYARSLSEAMPYLVRSIFADFPGGNGQTRTVIVPKIPK